MSKSLEYERPFHRWPALNDRWLVRDAKQRVIAECWCADAADALLVLMGGSPGLSPDGRWVTPQEAKEDAAQQIANILNGVAGHP